jgi:hypothetical protein
VHRVLGFVDVHHMGSADRCQAPSDADPDARASQIMPIVWA